MATSRESTAGLRAAGSLASCPPWRANKPPPEGANQVTPLGANHTVTAIDAAVDPMDRERCVNAVSVHDVAACLTRKLGALGMMKLEKLVYHCQGWWVARCATPLFPEALEAWRTGPVCPDLCGFHRGRNFVEDWPWGNADNLNHRQLRHIDAICDIYGVYPGFCLGDMTRQEKPWTAARARGGMSR